MMDYPSVTVISVATNKCVHAFVCVCVYVAACGKNKDSDI